MHVKVCVLGGGGRFNGSLYFSPFFILHFLFPIFANSFSIVQRSG